MKKFFLILTIALGMFAMSSCKCSQPTVDATEFVYDVVGTAEGQGEYGWAASNHTGTVSLNGTFKVAASNDTTSAKVLTADACNGAMPLSVGLASDNKEVAACARAAQSKLMLEMKLTGITGFVKLGLTGYVKYGMMVFALDEHWQYPPANEVSTEVIE